MTESVKVFVDLGEDENRNDILGFLKINGRQEVVNTNVGTKTEWNKCRFFSPKQSYGDHGFM